MKRKVLKLILLLVFIIGVSIALIYEISIDDQLTHTQALLWVGGIFLGAYAQKWSKEIGHMRRSRLKVKKPAQQQ